MTSTGVKMERTGAVCYTTIESPVGPLLLAGDAHCLQSLSFENSKRADRVQSDWKEDKAPFTEVIRQLRAYFSGKLTKFDVPLALEGTEFQLSVWRSMQTIPYGETISYGQLAQRIGNPKAVRAVGLANGCNPTPIIVPCHRVIGSNGSLTGFGGGLANKKILLELESRQGSLL